MSVIGGADIGKGLIKFILIPIDVLPVPVRIGLKGIPDLDDRLKGPEGKCLIKQQQPCPCRCSTQELPSRQPHCFSSFKTSLPVYRALYQWLSLGRPGLRGLSTTVTVIKGLEKALLNLPRRPRATLQLLFSPCKELLK
jgi:hypothetical protein